MKCAHSNFDCHGVSPRKTVLSNVNDGLVAQGVLELSSLLDALFCLEPYRNNGHDL